MERYGYRDKARIISIVDMVWSTINLGNTFLGFLALSAYYSYWNAIDQDHRKYESAGSSTTVNAGVGVIQSTSNMGSSSVSPSSNGEIVFSPRAFRKLQWMMVMAQFAIHFSQLTFAINLYTGTAKNATAKAPAACRLWFITSSLLLGILGLRLFFQMREANGIFCMSEIIFRAVGMYLVGEYAKEVKNTMIYPPPPPVYFSSHPDQIHQLTSSQSHSHSHRHHHPSPAAHHQHHHHHSSARHNLNLLPFFSPPYPELPPKYEEAIRQTHNCPGVVISTSNCRSSNNAHSNSNSNSNHSSDTNTNTNVNASPPIPIPITTTTTDTTATATTTPTPPTPTVATATETTATNNDTQNYSTSNSASNSNDDDNTNTNDTPVTVTNEDNSESNLTLNSNLNALPPV